MVYRYAIGSTIGFDHLLCGKVLVGRNYQDAFAVAHCADYLVAVLTDGCGSGSHSEVGANIGAKYLANALIKYLDRGCNAETALREARADLLAHIRLLATQMGTQLPAVIEHYFLFTTLVFIHGVDGISAYAVGDGIFKISGDPLQVVGTSENNTPAYIAYALVRSSISEELLHFRRLFRFDHPYPMVMLGTDGVRDLCNSAGKLIPGTEEIVGPLEQFYESRYFTNVDAISRRLRRLNSPASRIEEGRVIRTNGLLPDDTTLFVYREF